VAPNYHQRSLSLVAESVLRDAGHFVHLQYRLVDLTMAKWKIYLWRSRARDLVFLLETLEKVRCVGSGSRLEDLWGVLAELRMYYIFRVERTGEFDAHARQSIHRQIGPSTFRTHVSVLCLKQHSIRPSYVNSLRKPSLKRMQNHQDIGCSTYSTTVCSVWGGGGRLGGTGHTCMAWSNLQVEPEVCFAIP